MKRNNITKKLIIVILIIFSISISGCAHKDKELVLNSNVKKTLKQPENQVKKNIDLGNKFFDNGKYDDAKQAYERAVELDKKNKETYITIKDKYLSKGKLQEAYDIVKEAVTNNVDADNMKTLLSQINANIEKNKVAVEVAANEKNKNSGSNEKSDSSKQKVPVESKKIIGIVKNIYERNGKRYLTVNEVEFYMGDRAMQEAIKDNKKVYYNKDGKPELDDSYYIRDTDQSIKEYEISDSAKFSAPKLVFNIHDSENLEPNHPATYDKVKNAVNGWTAEYGVSENRINLYWLTVNNNVVAQMDQQYTP